MTDKTCFVISPIGADGSPERKRSDTALKHIFKPALEPLGYTVIRADEISQPGSITLQVLEKVLQSSLVVADLTDHNPNVFYELAVRHASEQPVIHVISSDQSIPFDVADLRTVKVSLDLEGAALARNEIAKQAKEIEKGHVGETPVKLAGVLKHLATGKTGSEEKLILKQVLDGFTEFKAEVTTLMVRDVQTITNIVDEAVAMVRRDIQNSAQSDAVLDARVIYERVDQYLEAFEDRIEAFTSTIDRRGFHYQIQTQKGRKAGIALPKSLRAPILADRLITALKEKDAERFNARIDKERH